MTILWMYRLLFKFIQKYHNVIVTTSRLKMISVLWLISISSACDFSDKDKLNNTLPVRVMKVHYQHTQDDPLSFPGTIVPRVESQLAFRVPGLIQKRLVSVGDQVSAGTLLAQLDQEPFQLAVNKSAAQLKQAQATLTQIEREVIRKQALKKIRAISIAEFDNLLTTKTHAESQVDIARSHAQHANNELVYTQLKASENSVITSIQAEVDQVISAGTPIMTLAYLGNPEVQIDIPENYIARVVVNEPAQISLINQPNTSLSGTVREIAATADPYTRTYRTRVALNEQHKHLKLGMTATVKLLGSAKTNMIHLPIGALFAHQQKMAIWVLPENQNKLVLRYVQVIDLGSDFFTLNTGIEPGEKVVTAGAHRLDENMLVHEWDGRLP